MPDLLPPPSASSSAVPASADALRADDAATDGTGGQTPLAGEAALLAEIADLKRVRAAHLPGGISWMTDRFVRSWQQVLYIVADETFDEAALDELAWTETARAVAAARAGAITPQQLRLAGLSDEVIAGFYRDAIAEHAAVLGSDRTQRLQACVDTLICDEPPCERAAEVPACVDALSRQPRAGATAPRQARILLDPPENHAEHCGCVAVGGVLAAARLGAPVGRVFLFGLAHHLHNATLADSGFAGEVLLSDRLEPALDALFEVAYAELPPAVASLMRPLRREMAASETPAARAFHTADVIDRVAEMRHFERAARFHTRLALHDLDLVHVGPTQAFGQQVLREAGWWQEGGS